MTTTSRPTAGSAAAAGGPAADPPQLDRQLGVFENAMILTQEYSPFNVVIVVRLVDAPPAAAVREALAALQRQQPALRCAVAGRRAHRRFVPSAEPLPLLVERRGDSRSWRRVVEEELAFRLPLERGPLARARLLLDDQGRGEIVLTLAHAIVDATSATHLVDTLLAQCGGVPVATDPVQPLPLLERCFPAPYRGLGGRLRAGAALLRSLGSELVFQLRTRRANLPGVDPRARSRITTWELDAVDTAALVRRCRREGVSLNSALAAALLLAVRRLRRGGRRPPSRLYTMADLRGYVVPPLGPTALGAGWAMLRLVVAAGDTDELWPTARAVQAQLLARLRAGEKFLAYLTIRAMMRIGLAGRRFRMGEVAVSYTGPTSIVSRYGSLSVVGVQVFVSNIDLGPECSVQARLQDGRLSLGVVFLDTDMDEPAARRLIAEAMTSLGGRPDDAGANDG